MLSDLKNKTITVLGLTYKANTNTLRRSSAIETCQWLSAQGVKVQAYDPAIKELPQDLVTMIHLKSNIKDALLNSDAVILATEWPEFHETEATDLLDTMKSPIIFDANGFFLTKFSHDQRIRYCSVRSGG